MATLNLEGWGTPPEKPELQSGEIHVWRIKLDELVPHLSMLSRFLNSSEQHRAARFHFQHDREHFAVGRGMLRVILSRYLLQAPEEIKFEYNIYGKPALDPFFRSAVRFNISHSHGIALIAVTLNDEIGVDVEWIRPEFTELKIANRFFAPAEVAALEQLPESLQKAGFFNCWTRKEAFIKAKGKGLSLPLNQFVVSLDPEQPAELLQTSWEPAEVTRWSLHALPIDPGFRAALAVEGMQHNIFRWNWDSSVSPE